MKYLVAFVICIMLLFIPRFLLGVDSKSIGNATLNLNANFSDSVNERCIVGFTSANVIDLYSSIKEESSLALSLSNGKYSGTINMFYQMENFKTVSVALEVTTPFSLIDDSAIPATVSFEAIEITGYNKYTTNSYSLNIESGNSALLFKKPSSVVQSNGFTTLSITVDENDVLMSLDKLRVGDIYATLSLVTTAE